MRACALIRDHGLDIAEPGEINGIYKELDAAQDRVRALEAGQPLLTDDMDDAPAQWQKGAALKSQWQKGAVVSSSVSWRTPAPNVPIRLRGGARWRSLCLYCSAWIPVGAEILWQKNVGAWCGTSSCYHEWLSGGKQPKGYKGVTVPNFDPFDNM
ncbi:hypothetical protein BH24ACT15_BH24ACT15_32200 [soil metagenome]